MKNVKDQVYAALCTVSENVSDMVRKEVYRYSLEKLTLIVA